jgi:hypothetical protein
MRRLFVIGEVPSWTTAPVVESAIRHYLETREDVAGHFGVLVTGNRVAVTQIPDPVAEELRNWYAGALRSGKFTQ